MTNKKFIPLQVKFIATILPIVILLTTAVLGVFEWNRYQDMKNMYRGHIDNIARSQALLMSEPPWNVDKERGELSLKGVVADAHISAAALYDEDGTLFVAVGADAEKRLSRTDGVASSMIIHTLDGNSRKIGTVRVAMNTEKLAREARYSLTMLAL